jgi:hypothetical protein
VYLPYVSQSVACITCMHVDMHVLEALSNACRLTRRAAVMCIYIISTCQYSTYSSSIIKQRAASVSNSSSNPWADSSNTDNYSLNYLQPDHSEQQQYRDNSNYSPTYSTLHSPAAEPFAAVGDVYNDIDDADDEPDALNESIGSAAGNHSGNSWLAAAERKSSSRHTTTAAASQNRAVAATATATDADADTAHTLMLQSTASYRAVSPVQQALTEQIGNTVQQSHAEQMRKTHKQASAVSPQRRSPNLSPQQQQQRQQQQQQEQPIDGQRFSSSHTNSSSSAVRSSHDAAAMRVAGDSSARHRPATAGDAHYNVTSDVALQRGASLKRSTVHARAVNSIGSSSSSGAVLVSPRQLRQTAASRIQAALADTASNSTKSASSRQVQHSGSSGDQPIGSYAVAHRERLSATKTAAAAAAVQSPVRHATTTGANAGAGAHGVDTTSANSSTAQYHTAVSPQRASSPLSPLLVMEDDELFHTHVSKNDR